ncbi:MAG TPA: fibronectin type III domain-containing protein, partial [Desulfobacteraceae bacterium]|nr:fibronectin type III domain-containing protein [Desulfobacteraceae bacterium]
MPPWFSCFRSLLAQQASPSPLPNSEADLAGYNLYYDTNSSGDYQNVINVGNQPQYTFVGLETGVTYRIALTAYDVYHNESDFSEEIQILIPQPDFKMEIGEVSLNHEWVRVDFQQPFVDPVVVANPLSCIGGDPTTARIRNVDGNGFEIRVQEWDYLNELHNKVESVSYLVMERGSYILDDGTRLEANSFATDDTGTFGTVSFDQPFQQVPVITTSIITENGSSAVTGRLQAISTESFQYCMQE